MERNVSTGRRSQGVIRPIQYLRAIAALMVVWSHSLIQVPGITRLITWRDIGPTGVDIFFVISGFIMVATTAGKAVTPAGFFRLRIVRVVPLYWLMTLLMVACAMIAPHAFRSLQLTPGTLAASLLFIPHFSLVSPVEIWPLLVPGWSLNFEMFFYVIFAACLFLPARSRLTALILILGVLALSHFAIHPIGAIGRTYTNPKILEFAAGGVLATLWTQGRLSRANGAIAVGAIIVGAILLSYFGLGSSIGAVLIVGGALQPCFSDWQSRLWMELGDASYSIYLSHLFALGLLRAVWAKVIPAVGSLPEALVFMAVALVVSAAAGYATYRWIEKPMTSWLRDVIRSIAMRGRNQATARAG